jgi:hypothetical protein
MQRRDIILNEALVCKTIKPLVDILSSRPSYFRALTRLTENRFWRNRYPSDGRLLFTNRGTFSSLFNARLCCRAGGRAGDQYLLQFT